MNSDIVRVINIELQGIPYTILQFKKDVSDLEYWAIEDLQSNIPYTQEQLRDLSLLLRYKNKQLYGEMR